MPASPRPSSRVPVSRQRLPRLAGLARPASPNSPGSANALASAPASPVIELVEVVDARDRPLAILPLPDVHAQQLRHRAVLMLVYNSQGKLYLQQRSKRKTLFPGCWDVSASGHVQAGEALEDAARREIKEELDLEADRLRLVTAVPASPFTGQEFLTVYSAGRMTATPRPNPEELEGGMFVDADELEFLAAQYQDVLTPGLLHLHEQGLLFKPS